MEPTVSEDSMKKQNKYGQDGKFEDWDIERWARDILDAERIKNDPEKMKYVKKCLADDAQAMNDAIESIDDIRAAAQRKGAEENEEA